MLLFQVETVKIFLDVGNFRYSWINTVLLSMTVLYANFTIILLYLNHLLQGQPLLETMDQAVNMARAETDQVARDQ